MENRKPLSELNLHPALKTQVEIVAANTTTIGAMAALNLLELNANTIVKETFVLPTAVSANRMNTYNTATNKKRTTYTLAESDFIVYPNPNQGSFTIQYDVKNEENELTIVNLMGAIVYSSVLTNGESTKTIDVKTLTEGFYFVLIKTAKGALLHQTKIAIIK
ncbi:MAG: T9SS type A sorting domain-containing protein [Vicingaceae bacterium]|nr:T9SS type A sorting domain-containing protein [Vicingaceae bacterium]